MPTRVPPIVQLARVPGRVPRVDIAIAAGLLVWALLEALFAVGPGSTPARILLAIGFTLPLAVRRRWPIPVLALIALCALVRGAMGGAGEEGAMPFPGLLLASFSAALYARPRPLAYAAAPVPIVAMPLAGYAPPLDYVPLCFLSLTAWTAGWLIRRRAEQLAQVRAEGPELAREAVAAERARMARDLHDVVAHSVTVISVQAGAAEELLERKPGAARSHLEAVRRSAHEALVELRRLVGVLREDTAHYAPQPGLARLDELLEEVRSAGLQVVLTEQGTHNSVPAGLDLTAYRIVQESLTNVRRHAGITPTRVRIRYGDDRLELEITNAPGRGNGGVGSGSGQGLIGMHERVRLYGGSLEAGPAADGGFVVRADLPLEAPPTGPARGQSRIPPARAGTTSAEEPGGEPLLRLARVPRGIPPVDIAIAAGLLLWALLEALFVSGPGPREARILLAVGLALPMVVRRRWPVPALVAVCLLMILPGVVFDGTQEGSAPFAVLLLATFSAALYARSHALAIAAVPVAVATIVLAVLFDELPSPGAVDIAIMSALTSGAWSAGFLIRRRAEQLAQARAAAPRLAREAVAAERARMARELHDVVAHSVTLISVQAGAAEELLEREPGRARTHLEAVRRSAHEALVELRRLVGVLREDEPAYSPQPGLERLDELLAEARAAGLPVELSEEGERGRVPAGVDLAAYRIAQESLTNVRRHGGIAPTRVRIRYGEESLELEVANAPGRLNGAVGPGSGQGLIGMRERARLYGGTLEADPAPDGGFVVRANLPFEAPPA